MPPEDEGRLRHMLDAAKYAISFVSFRGRAELETDRMLVFALVKAIEIIGEAAFRMSDDVQAEIPQIP